MTENAERQFEEKVEQDRIKADLESATEELTW